MPAALHRHRLSVCLVAVLLVTAGTPATAISTTSATAFSTTPSPPVMFADDVVTEHRSDVVEIGVLFRDAEVATVRIGSGETHVATVVVRDDDGDGNATLRLNTHDGTITASEGDSSSVRERSSVETPIAPGSYDLDLWIGNGTDGERWAVGILALQERSTHDLRTWVASGTADLPNLSAVHAAKASGNLTRSDTVVENDTFVLELRASGLEGVLAARNGSNATAAFLGLLDRETAELRLLQVNPSPEVQPAEIHLAEYDATRVVTDPANDSYYLVVDPVAANVTRGTREVEVRAGHQYDGNFSLPASSALSTDGTESVRTAFTVVEPAVEVSTTEEDREFVVAAPNQTVSGRTSLPAGTELTVELRSPGGDTRFSATTRVRNGSDGHGRFAVGFDVSGVSDGTNLTTDVRADVYPALDFEPTRVVVADADEFTVGATTTTVDPTTRATTDAPMADGTTGVSDGGTTATGNDGFVPGFGAGASLVALLVGLLFARRR